MKIYFQQKIKNEPIAVKAFGETLQLSFKIGLKIILGRESSITRGDAPGIRLFLISVF